MSGDPEQEYFSDGISEDIITALSKLRWFFVIARNSSFIYKGKAVHMKQVAEELGVGYVLEGSVRKGGDRVRITAQLNDVATGSHVWAEKYDRRLADVFAVQDEITEAIVAAIEPQLYAAENFRARRKPPESMDAWDLVMRALSHYWRVTRQDHRCRAGAAGEGDRHRSELRPGAWCARHQLYFQRPHGLGGHGNRLPIAESAALASIQADSEDPWAHHALGSVSFVQAALRRLARRVRSRRCVSTRTSRLPRGITAWPCHIAVAGKRLAWRRNERMRLSPRDPFSAIFCGIAAYANFVGRNYDEAIRLASESIRQRGDFVGGHRVLTAAAGMAGHDDSAKAALLELGRAQPNISIAWLVSHMPIRSDADREHYLEGFRRAGLH